MKIRHAKNRHGLTLLFVVSMIVLFLLMGTTFVIISNDYFKASRKRKLAKQYSIDRTALIHQAFYDLVRGPDLLNVNSPLRGHDLLSDQYGYGFKATVFSAAPVDASRGQLIEIVLSTTSTNFRPAALRTLDNGRQILGLRDMLADARATSQQTGYREDLSGRVYHTGSSTWLSPDDSSFTSPTYKDFLPGLDTPGYFSGQVLTFTNGQAKGVSARIVDYTVTEDSTSNPPVMIRKFIILPERVPNGFDTPFDDATEVMALGEIRDGSGLLQNTPSTVLINGRPFSGLGAATSLVTVAPDGALRPNNARYASSDPSGTTDTTNGSTVWDPTADPFFNLYSPFRDSVNEAYDSFDHNNVFLAQNLPSGPVASFNPIQMAPKHAPNNVSSDAVVPARVIQQNSFSFRPVFQWHPDYVSDPMTPDALPSNTANAGFPNLFDNSVPIANRPTGYEQLGIPHEIQTRPLDVDNDQDGINDSVWVDFGYSIFTTRDGRRIKPMVAPMIIDLDSRLNVNVHGTYAHAESLAATDKSNYNATYSPGYMAYLDLLGVDSSASTDTGATEAWNLARGLGWGPPEVSLTPLITDPADPNLEPDYRPLLVGTINTANPFTTFPAVPGRYGPDRLPGNSFFDTAAQFRFLDHPYPPGGNTIGGTFQGRPMDIHGRFVSGFAQNFESYIVPDPADATMTINVNVPVGSPIVDVAATSWPPAGPLSYSDPTNNPFPAVPTELYNSPYEISLIQDTRRSDDLMYSPNELEAVLRSFDVDSEVMASRLPTLGVDPLTKRHLVTTESWEVPTLPPTIFTRAGTPVMQTIPERLHDILWRNFNDQNLVFMAMRGGTLDDNGTTSPIHSLLPPEVMRGLPMNVNRVFGTGGDENGNGITDEHWNSSNPDENEVLIEAYPLTSLGMDHNNDGISGLKNATDFQDQFARQIFARHLFVLTWLVAGGEYDGGVPTKDNPGPPDMDGDDDRDDNDIALLAQWCVNIVDFRDADSICTPFKYDKNPWNGWEISPDILTTDPEPYDGSDPDVGVVWGIERPELLISEVIATHERRYEEDTSNAGSYINNLVPKSSVFVEVYNPWTSTSYSERAPSEFYQGNQVDLAQHHNSVRGGASGDPVWRLAFTVRRDDEADHVDARRVYMREPTSNVEASPAGNFYFPSTDAADTNGDSQIDPGEIGVGPNGYAVIGSSGIEHTNGQYRTTFGRRTDLGPSTPPPMDLKLDETRSITLEPGNGVIVYDGDSSANMTTETRNCTVVPIDTKGMGAASEFRSLGLTDPIAGYPASMDIDPDGDGDPSDGDGKRFLAPTAGPADDQNEYPEVFREGISYANPNLGQTDQNKRAQFVKLQRLANPIVEHDPVFNPYITIDVAPVDLLSFNGLADTDMDISSALADFAGFDTHERGDMNHASGSGAIWYDPAPDRMAGPTTSNERYLWPQEFPRVGMMDMNKELNDQHFFPQQFEETFGYMNRTYQGFDFNDVTKPFLWFTWNNRPYVSQYELVNVAMYRARDVLQNFDSDAQQVPQLNDSPIKRVFDFLEVPSRFVNMEVGFSATAFAGDAPTMFRNSSGDSYVDKPTVFNPPKNYVSRYRYPGKININTLTANQTEIWNEGMFYNWGIGSGRLAGVRADSPLNNAADDLGGYGSTAAGPASMIVMDPIRPDGSADFDLPLLPDTALNGVNPRGELSNSSVYPNAMSDGSIMRATGDHLYRTTTLAHENTDRDYWFTNSSVSKLANISTDRSSVFAIWITVGYFEVDDFGRLGAEIGSDTGEVTRNRGFFVFDRSIPVGYEPGKNHNVERGILVQSIIE